MLKPGDTVEILKATGWLHEGAQGTIEWQYDDGSYEVCFLSPPAPPALLAFKESELRLVPNAQNLGTPSIGKLNRAEIGWH